MKPRAVLVAVVLLCVMGSAIAAQAASITASMAGPGTIAQGSSASFTNTITLHNPGTSGTDWKEAFVWWGNETVPAPSATWNYGDSSTASGYFGNYGAWDQPITSTTSHVYYTPGNYTVRETGTANTAYVNSDLSYWIPSLGVHPYSFNNTTSVTVTNVVPQNAVVYQNGSSAAVTVNEGQNISRYMSATDPGRYDDLTFTVNGQGAGTATADTTGIRYSSAVYQTYTQDTNGSYLATGLNRVSDQWGGATTVAAQYRVLNVAPSITSFAINGVNGNISVNEGTPLSASMASFDPGADAQSFYINGQAAGVGGSTAGSTRYSSLVDLGTAVEHNGGVAYTSVLGTVYDDDTLTNLTRSITIYNLNPLLQDLTGDLTVDTGEPFNFAALATDPGLDLLTYAWDLDDDGFYDDYFGWSGSTSLTTVGLYTIVVQISDGDGGFAYGSFEANAVPEPATWPLCLLFAAGGFAIRPRRK